MDGIRDLSTTGLRADASKQLHRFLQRAWSSILLVIIACASLSGLTRQASAADQNCTRRDLSKGKNYYAYVMREGVGAVSWTIHLNIGAADLCNHGALTAGVWAYNENVEYKGGQLRVTSAQYQTSASDRWVYFPYRSRGFAYGNWRWESFSDGGHLDLTRNTRITLVRINTALYFGGSGYAARSFTCNLIKRVCW